MNDIGKCMGIYFYVIGLMQIISIIINYLTTGNIYLDLQFIGSLVVGYYLMQHHDKARKIVVIICGIIVLIQCAILLYSLFIGFSDFFCSFIGDFVGRLTSIEISLTNEVVTMKKINMMKTISSIGVILISLSSRLFLNLRLIFKLFDHQLIGNS